MTAVIFRRRGVGLHLCREIATASNEAVTVRTHNPTRRTARREGPWPTDTSLVFRWGCTARIPVPRTSVVNTAEAIHLVNDKPTFRMLLDEHGLCPLTWTDHDEAEEELDGRDPQWPCIVRPRHHSKGRHFYVCYDHTELREAWALCNFDGYISEVINKSAEYRVFVAQGRCVWVARKTPQNPEQIAWNHVEGFPFDNVRWGDWSLRVVRVAIEAFNLSGLDFGGVDVIVDQEGRAYVVEINSAPSTESEYRTECIARTFDHIIRNGKEPIPLIQERGGWRKFIHPALSMEAQVP